MKQIKTKTEIILVDDEDFDELNKYVWRINNFGYAYREQWKNNKGKKILMQRQILGKLSIGMVTDHIDRNKLNNQRSNLRICTQSENIFNSPKKKNNKSGHVGVRFYHQIGKWEAYIMKNWKKYNLGDFDTQEEAIKARKNGEKLLYPNFIRTV